MRDLKMLISMWLFVCLLSQLYGSVNSSNIQENTLKTDGVKDASAGQRREMRSTDKIFIAALGAILESAKEVPTGITNYKRFIKTGTRSDARRDFLALSPEFPDGKDFSWNGHVGDYYIKFRFSNQKQGKKPSILIIDPRSEYRVRVLYEKPPEE